ncbi:cellobiose dehydrogenase [Metarhizium robertsii ARSEF 23]|nr:cellobiose dehydrogenase [Metarhizium robertsii ARSEF 23]KHO11165.1 cellobiose dehydrogenase [Metarhizium robertsii ARSEF 23]
MHCAVNGTGQVAITSVIAVIAAAKEPYDTHRIEQLELASQDDARRLGVQGIAASIQPVHSGPVILKGHSQLISSQHEERAFFLYRGLLDGNACVAVETNSAMAKHQEFPNFYNPTTRTSACTRCIAERVQNLSSVLCRKGLGWCLSQTLDITYMALDPCFNLRIHRCIYLGKSHIIFDNINPVLREYFTLNLVAHHDTGPQIEYSSRVLISNGVAIGRGGVGPEEEHEAFRGPRIFNTDPCRSLRTSPGYLPWRTWARQSGDE